MRAPDRHGTGKRTMKDNKGIGEGTRNSSNSIIIYYPKQPPLPQSLPTFLDGTRWDIKGKGLGKH